MAPPPKKRPSTDELLRKWEADKKSRIFLQLAEEYRKQDFVDAAETVLKEGLKHHPNFQPAHVALARCYMAKSQLTEAQAELERVHSKSPDNLLAGKLLVEVLEARGEKNRALEIAKKLVPFAAFDDPEVEETAKRLEAELASPVVGRSGSSSTTGVGDTMDFAKSEATSDFSADAPGVSADDDGAPMLIDADAFADEEEEGLAPPPLPQPEPEPSAPAAEPAALDADSTHAELDADSTHAELDADSTHAELDADSTHAELDADSTHDELAAVGGGAGPLDGGPPPMPGSEEPPPEDLFGETTPQPAAETKEDDDLTSITLAELYEAQDSPHEALDIYEKLLAKRPDDADLSAAAERCRARIEGRDTGETLAAESEAAPAETSAEVPKWEPEPAPAAAAPRRESRDEGASPEQMQAMLAEYERWLTAVRAVRQ